MGKVDVLSATFESSSLTVKHFGATSLDQYVKEKTQALICPWAARILFGP